MSESNKPAPAKPSLQDQASSLWDKVQLVLAIAVGVLFIFIVLQNWEDVDIDVLIWDGTIKLSLLLIGAFLSGVLATVAFWGWKRYIK